MDGEPQNEPLFRANKRRKVLRKRASSGVGDNTPEVATNMDATITKRSPEYDESGVTGVLKSHKKIGNRKYGIGFTSGNGRRSPDAQNAETALVLANEDGEQDAIQSDRFVRPTGRVAVAENKHMTAYIDSKMAEMRSSMTVPISSSSGQSITGLAEGGQGSINSSEETTQLDRQAGSGANGEAAQRTYQQAQARSTRTYQRPTKRRPPQRDQTDVARDSIIDQILHESQVPLYQQPVAHTAVADGGEVDNDAATAEAFKAQLIMEMEEHKRRKPPPGSAAAKGTTTSTGPKLGGSRNQREKMRAMEEAKASSGKK